MPPDDSKATKAERDAASKAMLDNMARLKAMRLAREAVAPPAPTKKKAAAKAGKSATKSAADKTTEKAQALAAWLADQRSGGRRT